MSTRLKKLSARCSVNSEEEIRPPRSFRGAVLGVALLGAALGGAFLARSLSPSQHPSVQRQQTRPILQIVRQQPGLPDLADLVERLCPSVAVIVPQGSDVPSPSSSTPAVPASAFSDDGWLVTSAAALPPLPLDALFGDGRRVGLSDVRADPVSGLAVIKAYTAAAPPLPFSDQAFPRVGQFGFALATPVGTGCRAGAAMVGSDFLADGGARTGYVRLEPAPEGWRAGMPLLDTSGRVLGIGIDDPEGAVIPAPIASIILDELIRNSLSASTKFGFRAIDYPVPLLNRLGDVRSGAGVALVRPKSSADKEGLQAGDIVTAVNNDPVSSASELSRALDALPNKAVLTIQRRSQQFKLTLRRGSGS
jgi:S1-C subfamily serine protease